MVLLRGYSSFCAQEEHLVVPREPHSTEGQTRSLEHMKPVPGPLRHFFSPRFFCNVLEEWAGHPGFPAPLGLTPKQEEMTGFFSPKKIETQGPDSSMGLGYTLWAPKPRLVTGSPRTLSTAACWGSEASISSGPALTTDRPAQYHRSSLGGHPEQCGAVLTCVLQAHLRTPKPSEQNLPLADMRDRKML